MRSLVACVAVLALSVAAPSHSAAQADRDSRPQIRVVKTYDAFRHHDRARADATAAAIAANLPDCGPPTAMFDPLRVDSSRARAVEIVRQFDLARVPFVIEQAFARARGALPGPPVIVCVFAVELTKGIPYLGGVGGISMGAGRIHIYLHPTEDRFAKLPYTAAHEYYHEAERTTAPAITPDDVVVSEGKADYFAMQLYPELRPPHTIPRTVDELRLAWEAFQTYRRRDRPAFRSEFMIAAPPSPLPLWAGYKLGFEIARQYLSVTRSRPETWAAIPASTMIERFELPARKNRR